MGLMSSTVYMPVQIQATFCVRIGGSVLNKPWCVMATLTVLMVQMSYSVLSVLCTVTRGRCA
ncbi:hypothetical protein PDJAM_G00274030 [Pangasius djambal]|nr:hypothetical protein [Pangasius djambal]